MGLQVNAPDGAITTLVSHAYGPLPFTSELRLIGHVLEAQGGTLPVWQDAYTKAAKMVSQMSLVEKVNITTGVGWEMVRQSVLQLLSPC